MGPGFTQNLFIVKFSFSYLCASVCICVRFKTSNRTQIFFQLIFSKSLFFLTNLRNLRLPS